MQDSTITPHRPTVLLHLAALADRPGPQQVTADEMAADHPELDEQDWLGVLQTMARLGHAGEATAAAVPGRRDRGVRTRHAGPRRRSADDGGGVVSDDQAVHRSGEATIVVRWWDGDDQAAVDAIHPLVAEAHRLAKAATGFRCSVSFSAPVSPTSVREEHADALDEADR